MPLSSAVVGESGAPLTQPVDARWTMAYAAALGETSPAYFDTAARPDVLAHPLFPVCVEWPLLIGAEHRPADRAFRPEERFLGVHATHDVVLHRPLRAGTDLTTRAVVVRVEARRPGAYQLVRLDSESEGQAVCTTWYGTLFRGVAVEGPDRALAELEPPPLPALPRALDHATPLPIAAGAAHVYSECARIWNPIHTDAAVATGAGLPGLILHGTANLALAVSRVVDETLGGDATRVARVAGRFAAMVGLPSRCEVRRGASAGDALAFELRNEAGEAAVRDGWLVARP